MYTNIRAFEREATDSFKTTIAATRWHADVFDTVTQTWREISHGPYRYATAPQAHYNPIDQYWYARFRWSHFKSPLNPQFVAPIPFNGMWRLRVDTDVYTQAGYELTLENVTPACTFVSKR